MPAEPQQVLFGHCSELESGVGQQHFDAAGELFARAQGARRVVGDAFFGEGRGRGVGFHAAASETRISEMSSLRRKPAPPFPHRRGSIAQQPAVSFTTRRSPRRSSRSPPPRVEVRQPGLDVAVAAARPSLGVVEVVRQRAAAAGFAGCDHEMPIRSSTRAVALLMLGLMPGCTHPAGPACRRAWRGAGQIARGFAAGMRDLMKPGVRPRTLGRASARR